MLKIKYLLYNMLFIVLVGCSYPSSAAQFTYGDVVTYDTQTGIITGVKRYGSVWGYTIMFQSGNNIMTSKTENIELKSSFPWDIADEKNVEIDINKLDLDALNIEDLMAVPQFGPEI